MSVLTTFYSGCFLNKLNQFIRIGNINLRRLAVHERNYASSADQVQPSEKIENILKEKFPKAKTIEVVDLSSGCGSMYEIFVESVEFKGLSLVKQHRLINETLKEQIKNMHGLTVRTKIPDSEAS